jgi:hypothetical protein
MELPTEKEFDNILAIGKAEHKLCEGDNHTSLCQLGQIFSESELANTLVNSCLGELIRDAEIKINKEDLDEVGNIVAHYIAIGIHIGLQISEIRELERMVT